ERFKSRGVRFVESLEEVPEGAPLLYSAHGVSPQIREQARRRKLRAIDATCPLVTKVHLEAVKYAREGYTIVLIGHEGHDEVIGTMGEAPDRLVLASQNSSNSLRLADIPRSLVPHPHLIDGVSEIRAEWFEGDESVVITAGASAPEDVVQECIEYLQRRFGATIQEEWVRDENVHFPLPRSLRELLPATVSSSGGD